MERGGRYVSGADIEIEDDGKMEPATVGFQEKRIRREIANSNERRRMQSINAGFSSLRSLLPHHEQGEKLSKAAILQQTAEYIYSLEQEKTRLLSQNCQLKRLLGQTQHMVEADETDSGPAPKRRLIDTGQKLLFDDETDELSEIQNKYERERRTRMLLEEKVRTLESQVYPAGQRKILDKFTIDDRVEIIDGTEYQTILTPGAKKHGGVGGGGGMETLVLQAGDRLPSIIQCAMKDVNKVEVEHLPRLAEFSQDGTQAVEIANVQDPVTGATRQYILTQMGDTTSKQNLETIVEAIRHLEGDHLFSEESGPHQYVDGGAYPGLDEETGPHQVVKEEVVESTISLNEDSTMVEMTLPSLNSLPSITTLPHIPMSSLGNISLPTVPVSFTLTNAGNASSMSLLPQVPVSISHLDSITKLPAVTSIQHLELTQLPVVSGMSKLTPTLSHLTNPTQILSSENIELPNIGPPQTSPVNLELAGGVGEGGLEEVEVGEGAGDEGAGGEGTGAGGSMTPTSDVSAAEHPDHISNSPPQSSPVNLAQSQSADQ
jgi:transcription factor AP-4